MKFKKTLVLLAGLLVFTFAGCGKEEPEEVPVIVEVEEEEEEPPIEEEEEYPYLYQIIEEREEVDGKIQSYLSGEWVDAEIGTRRPIAVAIPNQKSCLPQYGISNASVIYQMPLRDNLTRLLCIFEDFDDLDRIGPVRSIRDYMVYTGLEHEAIICHWGTAFYANDLLNSDAVDNISQGTSGITTPTSIAFDRYDRAGSYNSTDSAYLFIDGLMQGVEKREYDWDYTEPVTPKFLFAADGVVADYEDAEDVTKIWPGTKGNYNTVGAYFEYDEETEKYAYSQYGNPVIDERTGEQLMVDNVVLQICHAEERDNHGYLIMEMHGASEDKVIYFFTRGKMVKGTWSRMDGDDKPAHYYDMDGNELVFNQGQTYICQIWDKWAEYIEME